MKTVQITLTEAQLEAIKKAGILDTKGDWFEPKMGMRFCSWCGEEDTEICKDGSLKAVCKEMADEIKMLCPPNSKS